MRDRIDSPSLQTIASGAIASIKAQPVSRWLWSDRTMHVFVSNAVGWGPETDLDIRINDMAHVERFEQTERWLTRDDFIAQNRQRIETPGMVVVTIADRSGPLLGYIFGQVNARDSYFGYVDRRVRWPERTATTYGAYMHPSARGRRLVRALAVARNRYFIEECGMQWIGSAVNGGNASSLQSNTRGPSKVIADLRTRCRFGIVSKSEIRYEVFPDFWLVIE